MIKDVDRTERRENAGEDGQEAVDMEFDSTIYNGSVLGSDEIPPPSQITVSQLTSLTWKVVQSDIKWIFCFLGAAINHFFVYLYGSYMMLWLAGFIDKGVLKDDAEVQ